MSTREKCKEVLAEKLNDKENDSELSTGNCWSVMKASLLAAIEEVVWYGGKVQESYEILMKLIDERMLAGKLNKCYKMIFHL